MKVVYIAHPVSGDVEGNKQKIAWIVRHIMLNHPDVLPVAPYYLMLDALDDNVPEERQLGMTANAKYLGSGKVDEVWVYGEHCSDGVYAEIELARFLEIPYKFKTVNSEYSYQSRKMEERWTH